MFSLLIQPVYAQFSPVTQTVDGISNLGGIFAWIINLILGIGWALVFIMGALGFVQYIMSKGETKAVEGARNWLTSAAIGGAGLFLLTSLKIIIPSLLGTENTPGATEIGDFIN